eukprot:7300605-Lingulodinium_polyedra.AAC.1
MSLKYVFITPHLAHGYNFVLGSKAIVGARSSAAHPGSPAIRRGDPIVGLSRRFLSNSVNGPVS